MGRLPRSKSVTAKTRKINRNDIEYDAKNQAKRQSKSHQHRAHISAKQATTEASAAMSAGGELSHPREDMALWWLDFLPQKVVKPKTKTVC
ncbi:hypothetical protein Psyaliredsea_14550 [Psychrobacter alimentarius]